MSPPQVHPVPVSTRRAFTGNVIAVDVDTLRGPAGDSFDLEIIRHRGAAAVVPVLSDLKSPDPALLLIRQFRHAAGGPIWEIPAGVLQPGEAPEACARRELQEETGAIAGHIERLTTILTTPGFTDERIHLFMATDLKTGEPHRESDEFIEVETLPLSRTLGMIQSGEIQDGKTIAALMFLAGFRLGW